MALHKIADISDYADYLRNDAIEIGILCRELTIPTTSFFRDREAFEALRDRALPLLVRDKSFERPVRVWVPGCSTGEEAYSLAIILHEYAQKSKKRFKTQIFATDIDKNAIDSARAGEYADNIALDVSPERLRRYFTKKGDTYKLNNEIREMVIFSTHNLLSDFPFSRLDLLSCRNLLIYLEPELQERILSVFHHVLNPEGVLFLGPAESIRIGDESSSFHRLDYKWKIYQARK